MVYEHTILFLLVLDHIQKLYIIDHHSSSKLRAEITLCLAEYSNNFFIKTCGSFIEVN